MKKHVSIAKATAMLLIGIAVIWYGVLPAFQPSPTYAQQSAQAETISRCRTALPSSVAIDTATSGNVELVALTAAQRVYVCGFAFESDTLTTTVQFVYGTGTACDTGETNLTGPMTLLASNPLAVSNGGATQFTTAAGNALCIELGAATQVNGHLTYVKY